MPKTVQSRGFCFYLRVWIRLIAILSNIASKALLAVSDAFFQRRLRCNRYVLILVILNFRRFTSHVCNVLVSYVFMCALTSAYEIGLYKFIKLAISRCRLTKVELQIFFNYSIIYVFFFMRLNNNLLLKKKTKKEKRKKLTYIF